MTLDDLVAALAPVGVPIIYPGDTTRALPAVQIVPAEWQLRPGYPALYPVVDLYVLVDLTPYDTQHVRLTDLLTSTLRALAHTSFNLDPTVRFTADAEADPQYQAAVVNVRYPGPDVCAPETQPTTAPAPGEPLPPLGYLPGDPDPDTIT